MLVSVEQPENAEEPIVVTLLGISTLARPIQDWNTEEHIVVVPSLMAIDVFTGIVPLYL